MSVADASTLVPLTVAVPLITAALLAAVSRWIPRRGPDLAALAAAVAVTVMSVALVVATRDTPIVYWFGGWHPVRGVALGIDFVVEPAGASLAALSGVIAVASLVFSWRYFEEVGHLYHTLVLTLLAGMVGFSLSGDLFNIFVWLELMSVAAYALCGYQIHQSGVVQGALTFAVLNTIGTLTLLMGIALVYGRTGALNLAQIGESLHGHPPGGPVIVAFTLITAGLLVKAGAVPFHFWLADAYTVVPAPVGALFAGVMSDLAYHTFARVYWDGFSDALAAHRDAVRDALLVLAVASILVGAVMALLEAELKRQVAFATVANGGLVLAGIALLTPRGLGGATMLVVVDGLLKAALFLLIAAIIQWLDGGDELLLHGRGRRRGGVLPGVLLAACGLGFALVPPFGPFLGTALAVDAAGRPWLTAVAACGAAATGAVFLRAAARIFLGWGPREDPAITREPTESREGEPEFQPNDDWKRVGHRIIMLAPPTVLVIAGYVLSLVPGVADWFTSVAHGITTPHRTAEYVLSGHLPPLPPLPHSHGHYAPGGSAWACAAGSLIGSVLLAAASLWWQRLGRVVRRVLLVPVAALKSVHDGAVGDYTLWFATGVAALGAVWTLTLR
ncbi:complex I subunit 5 family protein [Streptomyces montanisoli]|uniref:NADH-quinone oxidoreductase subunit D n=1 Tax=Streptomyces montanisoli TaxID=2798581 RepID=A0A940RV82_9ACTN|nr:proton-conducting transporter membrane subunit [Streptomyces montanisoli]MBP0458767.1 NADH-quinone oxidoreductase subunit D [Streptomyces montanisoli]